MEKWDGRFLSLAQNVSTWSKDPSTKVGAVIVDNKRRVVSVGYNGFAANVNDNEERYNDRSVKYEMIIHGEINAILFANRDLSDCTLYTYPFMPCSRCAAIVIQSGIKRVVAPYSDDSRWKTSFELSQKMFQEANVLLAYKSIT